MKTDKRLYGVSFQMHGTLEMIMAMSKQYGPAFSANALHYCKFLNS